MRGVNGWVGRVAPIRLTEPRSMADRIRKFSRGRDLALVYAAIVVGVVIALEFVSASTRDELVLHSSTNLDNLRHRPINVLVVSAFVLGSPWELAEVPLLIWAYGALQRWLGRGATMVTGVFGHVGATLFVAVLLATGITRSAISPSVSHVDDVGVSYGMVAVAGVCTIRVPRRWLVVYVGTLFTVIVSALVLSHTFTDVGHLTAWSIGLALAVVVAAARQEAGPKRVSKAQPPQPRRRGLRRPTQCRRRPVDGREAANRSHRATGS